LNIVLLNTHNIFPSDQVGGIEKRIEAFVKYCRSNDIKLHIISSKKINLENYLYIDRPSEEEFIDYACSLINPNDRIISYNLSLNSLKILDKKQIKTINANCSGLAKNQKPFPVYSSSNIKARFLSLNQMKSYKNFFNEKYSCVIPHGLSEDEYFFNEKYQTKSYFLWCASLGWGFEAKGLDIFLKLSKFNKNIKFVMYGAPWNSENLENYLKNINLPNFYFNLALKDEDKNRVFSNAIALCQFTRLIESCNIITLESYSRGTPVISLNENQGGVTNNSKFFDLTMARLEDFNIIKDKALNANRKEIFDYAKENFHCKKEYNSIIEEFNK